MGDASRLTSSFMVRVRRWTHGIFPRPGEVARLRVDVGYVRRDPDGALVVRYRLAHADREVRLDMRPEDAADLAASLLTAAIGAGYDADHDFAARCDRKGREAAAYAAVVDRDGRR